MELEEWRAVPKVELHRHLEGSIRASTVHELSSELRDLSFEIAREKLTVHSPTFGLQPLFERFWMTQRVLDCPEIIERVTFEACEDAAIDGIKILELRYQPSFIQINHPSLSMEDIHSAIYHGCQRAMKAYPGFYVGLIGIIGRNLDKTIAQETLDLVLRHRDCYIGLDLANAEVFDCVPFASFFQKAKENGIRVTIHQGEEGNPRKVRDAIEVCGADRIGHGVQIINDQETLEFVRHHQVPLEVCVTSNYLVGVVPSISEHPIKQLINAGIRVTINTDDPAIFGGVSLSSEYALVSQQFGLSREDIIALGEIAFESSFVPLDIKNRFWPSAKMVILKQIVMQDPDKMKKEALANEK